MTDPFIAFKAAQRERWSLFAPLATFTVVPAAHLVRFAAVRGGERVLDVATGTGVVAVTAAREGATVSGLDLSPELIERARVNASIAGVGVELVDGDVEALPYADASFDVVLSQFGHMFAPRPEVAVAEMLRVLKPGGRIAFSTWPPDQFIGRMFTLIAEYQPPPPGVAAPPAWGDPNIVRERLGEAVRDLFFERELMVVPTLSVAHYRSSMEQTAGPLINLVASAPPEVLARFRAELDALIGVFLVGNVVRQHFLMSRAYKQPDLFELGTARLASAR